jgi:hypothetical protein
MAGLESLRKFQREILGHLIRSYELRVSAMTLSGLTATYELHRDCEQMPLASPVAPGSFSARRLGEPR